MNAYLLECQVLNIIEQACESNFSVSVDDIALLTDTSKRSIEIAIITLEKKGKVECVKLNTSDDSDLYFWGEL